MKPPDPPADSAAPRRGTPTAAEARAEVEAARSVRVERRRAVLDAAFADGIPGRAVISTSVASTVVLAVVTVLAVADPDRFIAPFFAVAVVFFVVGSALFALDVVLAAARSRTHRMGIGGLFFLAGSAPRRVVVWLNGSLAAACVVTIAGAASDPYTPLAFGTLAPMLQLALTGLWGVRHGHFPQQDPSAGGSGR